MTHATASDLARLDQWNARAFDARPLRTVVDRFLARVAADPDAPAIVDRRLPLTYARLAERAEALARVLVARGAVPGDRIALCVGRGPDLAVALLAILRAGCAYLPIEPNYPRARIEWTIADATPRLFLCDRAHARIVPAGSPALVLEDLPPPPAVSLPAVDDPEAIAYVLYTSGSTGRPKGVLVPHRAIDRLAIGGGFAQLDADTVILQASPVAFDASTFEIWGSLLNGGRLAFHDETVPTAKGLGRAIREHGVTTMWLTSALFNAVVDEDPRQLLPLRELLIGGEALSPAHVRRAYAALPTTRIVNGYGPTETTTFASCHAIPRDLPPDLASIPIGRAIRRTRCYVVDAALQRVAIGEEGELLIGGDGVALGYLARPDLTAERFLPDPWRPGERVYRTGDLVRFLDDGVLEYRGRIDQQVKIRGFRIELGEIEHAIAALPGVRNTAVVAQEGPSAEKRLVAYVVLDGQATLDVPATRADLARTLPEFMVPARFVQLDALPRTANGKLDQRALPKPAANRPELAVDFRAPSTPTETKLCRIWAEALDVEPLGVLDNFFELGANSLLVVRTAAVVERELGVAVPIVRIFEHPTVAGLAELVDGAARAPASPALEAWRRRGPAGGGAIAIIGMSGRFPGAADVEQFWQNLLDGKDGISHWRPDELDPSLPRDKVAEPGYVRARGVLEDVESFDAAFFGIPPKEAALMDPQQRLLLEECWKTLESAGYVPGATEDVIGVFAGKYNAWYFENNVRHRPDLVAEFGEFQTMLANEKDYIATRVANRLNLKGPAISTHTACSTSLVAIAQAVQALQSGQCDLALAGGSSIVVPVRSGYLYREGEMLSPDGRTRTFDANAQGTVFSDGVAVVLLKRLDRAIADRDTIHAVIRGAAINNDGGDKASFTAPSIEGQSAVIAMAQAAAGVSPDEIGYVEAHGTATPLGDPIEVQALTQAFRLGTERVGYCGIGSVKSNVGHLVIAAGATGVIKTALALARGVIPKSLWFERPNPKLELESSPFRVVAENQPWPRSQRPRFCGVSSFGVGGTNAHVVLAEPPLPAAPVPGARGEQLLLVSARSEAALQRACDRLADHLERHPEQSLADVAFTLHAGRRRFAWTRAVVAADHRAAAGSLRQPKAPQATTLRHGGAPRRLAFLFPGQGSQYPGMGGALYRDVPGFRAGIDACAEILRPVLGEDLRPLLFPAAGREPDAAHALQQTRITQPALFSIEYCLARLWRTFGVEPACMVGHSVGEFVCAALAGVMSLEDALRLVASRGRRMQEQPAGAMLSVRAGAAAIESRLPPDVTVASDNSPQLCVVAGPTARVDAVRAELEAAGIACQPLVTSHAFHTAMMDGVVEPFRQEVAAVTLREPAIPFVSTATGTWITAAEATDPGYWARHLRVPVRFAAAVRTLLGQPDLALLEVGPRTTLATLARQQIADPQQTFAIGSLGNEDATTWTSLLAAAGRLHQLGVRLDPVALHGAGRGRVPLPTYPFERQRHWIDAPLPAAAMGTAAARMAPGTGAEDAATALGHVLAEQTRLMQEQLRLLTGTPPPARQGPDDRRR